MSLKDILGWCIFWGFGWSQWPPLGGKFESKVIVPNWHTPQNILSWMARLVSVLFSNVGIRTFWGTSVDYAQPAFWAKDSHGFGQIKILILGVILTPYLYWQCSLHWLGIITLLCTMFWNAVNFTRINQALHLLQLHHLHAWKYAPIYMTVLVE